MCGIKLNRGRLSNFEGVDQCVALNIVRLSNFESVEINEWR